MRATHRKNGSFGYKALVIRADGSTHQPARRNFPSADDARAYAQRWIDANLANHARQEQARVARHAHAI